MVMEKSWTNILPGLWEPCIRIRGGEGWGGLHSFVLEMNIKTLND